MTADILEWSLHGRLSAEHSGCIFLLNSQDVGLLSVSLFQMTKQSPQEGKVASRGHEMRAWPRCEARSVEHPGGRGHRWSRSVEATEESRGILGELGFLRARASVPFKCRHPSFYVVGCSSPRMQLLLVLKSEWGSEDVWPWASALTSLGLTIFIQEETGMIIVPTS